MTLRPVSAERPISARGLEAWRLAPTTDECRVSSRPTSARLRWSQAALDTIRTELEARRYDHENGLTLYGAQSGSLIEIVAASPAGPNAIRERSTFSFDPEWNRGEADKWARADLVRLGGSTPTPVVWPRLARRIWRLPVGSNGASGSITSLPSPYASGTDGKSIQWSSAPRRAARSLNLVQRSGFRTNQAAAPADRDGGLLRTHCIVPVCSDRSREQAHEGALIPCLRLGHLVAEPRPGSAGAPTAHQVS